MRILAVDDEELALEGILETIREAVPTAELYGCRRASQALQYAQKNRIDVAFLDIKMREMNGDVLAEKLQDIYPQLNIIFTTGYSDYMKEAFDLHASGYLLKPITEKKVQKELAYLRYPAEEAPKGEKIYVRTFGNFEAYYQGVPLHFKYKKTKELFAYLIDRRGAMCGLQEVSSVLWEGDTEDHTSYLKNLRRDLSHTLEECDNDHIMVRRRGQLGLIPSEVYCDYFNCLETGNMEEYTGEYMSQYSWGEFTHGILEEKSKNL